MKHAEYAGHQVVCGGKQQERRIFLGIKLPLYYSNPPHRQNDVPDFLYTMLKFWSPPNEKFIGCSVYFTWLIFLKVLAF